METLMISSGELFLLNAETNGQFCPLPQFLNQNIRVISAGFDKAYTICEPAICREDVARRPCTVWCFQGTHIDPFECHEFSSIDGDIRQIAIGEKHLLVLTHTGEVYSKGESYYGSAGYGGAKSVQEFTQIPALKNRNVAFVAAGPHFSIAITKEGDVFSWGQSFSGETGLFSKIETVPRFASSVTPFRITSVSCGNAHVLACTESSQCIAWGENTCGQLGLGQKSKAVHKPQVVSAIPTHVGSVSAGWAHSVAVTRDGRVFTWGLNTHGQLGLGDTQTKFAVHLVHALDGKKKVASANASRTFTVFRTEDCNALICGSVPRVHCDPNNLPRRPGEDDPPGCVLTPIPLELGSGVGGANTHSEIAMMCAFDNGAIGFARSTVFTVLPSLAPLEGGTQIQAFVTGLPYEQPQTREDGEGEPYLQDLINIKVRLKSLSPVCDVTVEGRIVDVDTIEFLSPNLVLSPLNPAVEQDGCAPVSLQVSIDGGLTWTAEQTLEQPDLSGTKRALDDLAAPADGKEPHHKAVERGIRKMQAEIDASAQAALDASLRQATLWYCKWPQEGPSHMTPECAPVSGGTELLLYVNLPEKMPTTALTVKFSCEPVKALEDESKYASAPVIKDIEQLGNVAEEEAAKLPLAGPLDVFVCGHLDPGGRGVRCISPPLSPENVNFFKYHVELSLDGRRYLSNPLSFTVFDLRVTKLHPNVGPLTEPTEVEIDCDGLVQSEIQKVKLTFPWGTRELPAAYDYTRNKVKFMMPELRAEVRENVLADLAKIEERDREFPTPQVVEQEGGAPADDGDGEPVEFTQAATAVKEAIAAQKKNKDTVEIKKGLESKLKDLAAANEELSNALTKFRWTGTEFEALPPLTDMLLDLDPKLMASVDKDGGLHALETTVELSLNGQNFTDDKISFTYYGTLVPQEVVVLEGPEDKPKPDEADKLPPQTVLGVAVDNLIYTEYACMRCKMMVMITGNEEPVEGQINVFEQPKIKFEEKEPGDDTAAREMITVKVPTFFVSHFSSMGEVTEVMMQDFEISLNDGKHWVPCKERAPFKIELQEDPVVDDPAA